MIKIQSLHEPESVDEAATESRELGQALRAVERTDTVIVVQQLQFLLKITLFCKVLFFD